MGDGIVVTKRFTAYPRPPTNPMRVTAGSTAEIVLAEQQAGPAVDGAGAGRGLITRIEADSTFAEWRVLPASSFADDWSDILAMR